MSNFETLRAARNDMLAKAETAENEARAVRSHHPASDDARRLLNRASYFRSEAARIDDTMKGLAALIVLPAAPQRPLTYGLKR